MVIKKYMKTKIEFPDFLPEDTIAYLKQEEHGSIIQGFVDKINRHGLSNSRYLILTNYELFLYEKVKFHNEVVEKTRITYFDIKKIEVINRTNIIISFGSPVENDDIEKYVLNLKEEKIIPRVLMKLYSSYEAAFYQKEKPEFVFPPGFPVPAVERNSITERMKMQLRKQGKKLDIKAINDIIKFFTPIEQKEPDTFKLNQILSVVEYLPVFLDSLQFKPNITKIIVPCNLELSSQQTLFSVLGEFIKNNSFIKSFTFIGKIPTDFSKFVDGYVANNENNVSELYFQKCDFSENDMQDFTRLISHKPISTLHLISCVNENVALTFFKIFSNPGFQSITNLNIDGNYGVNIKELMPNLENVKIFSAKMCGINLLDFFVKASELTSHNLTSVILTGNLNIDLITDSVVIPENIQSLLLSDIAWDRHSFKNVFQQCINLRKSTNDFAINLSNTKMSQESWNFFFDWLQYEKSDSMSKLFWNENPISYPFFQFLFNSPNLKNVSLSGCFSDSNADKKNRQYLKEFIRRSKNLEFLHLDGTRRKSLGKKGVETIFKALTDNKHITMLSLRFNHGGNSILDDLSKCLEKNRVLKYIALDGNDITSLDAYIDFFNRTRKRCKEFVITWPEKETRDMIQYGEVTEDDVRYARTLYMKMRIGDNTPVRRKGKGK